MKFNPRLLHSYLKWSWNNNDDYDKNDKAFTKLLFEKSYADANRKPLRMTNSRMIMYGTEGDALFNIYSLYTG